MGNVSIDLSLNNIWQSWFKFKKEKKTTKEFIYFQYYLEDNLWRLYLDLYQNTYRHGPYRRFTIKENKRRDLAVAAIRDRVIHRLLYEYLVPIYNKIFIYDVWSCRKNKGLLGAIERTQVLLKKYSGGFIWRADIAKFFDNVNKNTLINIISRKIKNETALNLIKKVVASYGRGRDNERERERERVNNARGIPIGNLTSQIFANIYLNEFDRFVKHFLKPKFYLRYGDDFIIIAEQKTALEYFRSRAIQFLKNNLGLAINPKNDIILSVRRGIYFLGTRIYPAGRRLKSKSWHRAVNRLNSRNVASYHGLISQHYSKKIKYFDWLISNLHE